MARVNQTNHRVWEGGGGGGVEANTNTDYCKQNSTVQRSSSQLKMVTPEPGTSKDVISLQTKLLNWTDKRPEPLYLFCRDPQQVACLKRGVFLSFIKTDGHSLCYLTGKIN